METLESLQAAIRAADAAQNTEAAEAAALEYEVKRFAVRAVARIGRQPYFVQNR